MKSIILRFSLYTIELMLALTLAIFTFVTCSDVPQEIHYGSDECAHCQMLIMDPEFAAETVSKTGKAYKFDSIECMAAYLQSSGDKTEKNTHWVHDFNSGEWLESANAVFVQSEVIKTPMGMGFLAFGTESDAQEHINEYPGRIISFDELMKAHMMTPTGNMILTDH